jgi:hypothetical protein
MEAIVGKFKVIFIAFYLLSVIGSVQNYEKNYGSSVSSLIGIFDNFIVNLLPAAIFTGIAYLIYKAYLKLFKRNSGQKGEQS